MKGILPDIGLKWDMRIINDVPLMKIIPRPLKGLKGRARTLQAQSIGSYGVKLFNAMPWDIRSFNGETKDFKKLLDSILSTIPDEPFTENLHPSAKNLYGDWSNCITDWIRIGRADLSNYTTVGEA